MEECCSAPLLAFRQDGKPLLVLNHCRDRLCPRCQCDRARRAAGRIEACVKDMDSPRFVTLTLRHVRTESLAAMIDRLHTAFRVLRKNPRWKRRVRGGVWSVEVTLADDESWHAHLHLICDGEYYSQAELSLDWECASKGSRIVDIRAVHSRGSIARYISVYVAKAPGIADWKPEKIREWATAMHGRRLIHTFGIAHGVPVDGDETPTLPIEPICATGMLCHAAEKGSTRAIEAIRLLRRCGPNFAALAGCGPGPAVPIMEPLDSRECAELRELALMVLVERERGEYITIPDPPPYQNLRHAQRMLMYESDGFAARF